MFDIGWSELLVVGVVALVVIGPKDLPGALRMLGRYVAKARVMAREFQTHVDDMMRQAELDELKKKAEEVREAVDIRRHVENTIDPTGALRDAFNPPGELTGATGPSTSASTAASAADPNVVPPPVPTEDPSAAAPVSLGAADPVPAPVGTAVVAHEPAVADAAAPRRAGADERG